MSVEKGLNLGPMIGFSPLTMPSSQGALCQAVSGPKIYEKINYWNGTPILFP